MNQTQQTSSAIQLTAENNPVSITDLSGNFIAVNDKAVDFHRYSRDALLGMNVTDVLLKDGIAVGKRMQQVMNGELSSEQVEIQRGDGSTVLADIEVEHLEENGVNHFRNTVTVVQERLPPAKDRDAADELSDTSALDGIPSEKIRTTAEGIHIKGPSGELSLNEAIADIAVGHNEVENYKQGALAIRKGISDRLEKERVKNQPNETYCKVLQEAKKSAFGLYLRVQRGDQELTGNRDGEYSGYLK
jgi:PAS domain S-box-containing protein